MAGLGERHLCHVCLVWFTFTQRVAQPCSRGSLASAVDRVSASFAHSSPSGPRGRNIGGLGEFWFFAPSVLLEVIPWPQVVSSADEDSAENSGGRSAHLQAPSE